MYSTRARTVNLLLGRQIHGNAEIIENCKEIRNRNPRNLERLRIARKPAGYHLEKPGFSYWHKLVVTRAKRYVTAEIHHFENGPIIGVASNEWALKKQLYRLNDASAFINVGRVLAQRCLESGICEVYYNKEEESGENTRLLLLEVEKGGVCITEPERYKHPNPWDQYRPEKPWDTVE